MSNRAFFKILAARSRQDAAAVLNDPAISWEQLINDAILHQCAPYFRERLSELDLLADIPVEIREQLALSTRECAFNNLQGLRSLHLIMQALNGSAPLIVVKGACLSREYYRDVSLRQMRDLDVLARPEHMGTAARMLSQLGYQQDRRFEEVWRDLHQEPTFFKDELPPVELHRSLLDNREAFDIDDDGLWSRAIAVSDIHGLWYLAPEDQFIHVCLHAGYAHEFDIGLYAFIDIAMMARSAHLDWDLVIARARQWRAERCVFLSLKMAQALVAANIPDRVVEALAPQDFDAAILQQAIRAVHEKMNDGYDPARMFSQLVVALLDRNRWSGLPGKIKRRFLLPPSQRQIWKGSASTGDWVDQLTPLFKGGIQLLSSRSGLQRLRARLGGNRLKRWMESPR